MKDRSWCEELQQRLGKYDLLSHPFYVAWSNGELTCSEIAQYAANYYHHVKAFPAYLSKLESKLPDSPLKAALARNIQEENGHDELWLDFAEGMGAQRQEISAKPPIAGITSLIDSFSEVAEPGTLTEALAFFYAYESQVPRIAEAKECGLRKWYGADDKTCFYFTVHKTADIKHSNVWLQLLENQLEEQPQSRAEVIEAGERAAAALWQALDAIEFRRQLGRRNMESTLPRPLTQAQEALAS